MLWRIPLFLFSIALFAQQPQPTGPFRPGTNTPVGLPPTVPQKGPNYYPLHVAFINAFGFLDGITGSASDCVHVDGSSGECGGGGPGGGGSVIEVNVWNETPAGSIDGTNLSFTVAVSPNPAASLALRRNGLKLTSGQDFNLSGRTIAFISGEAPQPGDILRADYQAGYSAATPGAQLFSALPACATGTEGAAMAVTDSSANTWGSTVTGGGSNHVQAYCNGTNWTVSAK